MEYIITKKAVKRVEDGLEKLKAAWQDSAVSHGTPRAKEAYEKNARRLRSLIGHIKKKNFGAAETLVKKFDSNEREDILETVFTASNKLGYELGYEWKTPQKIKATKKAA